jgi:hypothetical protein
MLVCRRRQPRSKLVRRLHSVETRTTPLLIYSIACLMDVDEQRGRDRLIDRCGEWRQRGHGNDSRNRRRHLGQRDDHGQRGGSADAGTACRRGERFDLADESLTRRRNNGSAFRNSPRCQRQCAHEQHRGLGVEQPRDRRSDLERRRCSSKRGYGNDHRNERWCFRNTHGGCDGPCPAASCDGHDWWWLVRSHRKHSAV